MSGSHGSEYEDVCWYVTRYSLLEIDRRFVSVYCLWHQDPWWWKYRLNVPVSRRLHGATSQNTVALKTHKLTLQKNQLSAVVLMAAYCWREGTPLLWGVFQRPSLGITEVGHQLNNISTEQSPFLESGSRLARHEIRWLSCNQKSHYPVHRNPTHVPSWATSRHTVSSRAVLILYWPFRGSGG
jgi:hypothetical protein